MHTQKFDPTKPHGTIWGHPVAMYEQHGTLFDCEGNPVDKETFAVGTAHQEDDDTEESREVIFLRNILAGGPVSQPNIKKESEGNHLVWSSVLGAAAKIGVIKYKQGMSNVWKLEVR